MFRSFLAVYMKLSVYQPYREKCYILEKPLDMDYVLSLF